MSSSVCSTEHSTRRFYPPADGSLFVPEMLEYIARHSPYHPFFVYPDEQSNELRSISHLEFYRASQRIAHAVRPDPQGHDGEVVGIVANIDSILYQTLFMGIIYAGWIPLPISPRNSSAAIINLLKTTKSHRLIATQSSLGGHISEVKRELASHGDEVYDLQIDEPPTLATMYPYMNEETINSPFTPYAKGEISNDHVMFYLHSSGSTGFPKPIPITHLTGKHYCIMTTMTEHRALGYDVRVAAGHLPPFHIMGVFMQIFLSITSLQSISVYAPTSYHDLTKPPVVANAQNALENAILTGSGGLLVVPAFLEEWASMPESVKQLTRFLHVTYGGGPLAKKAGDALVNAGMKLGSFYGATEVGAFVTCIHTPEDQKEWEWVRPGPNTCVRWAPLGDGTFECQLLSSETHQVSVENLPDVKGYATSDVFIKHHTIEGLYKVVGRLDDVIMLSTGEKTVPAPMESVIGTSRYVSGGCMFGRGRPQAGVLVEPKPEYAIDVKDEKLVAEFRNLIWPVVEEANKDAPDFSRIFKEMILVTSKDKPMLRTGKGTVAKKATLSLYESEIDALYKSVKASSTTGIEVPLPSEWTAVKPVDPDVDLFEQGFDRNCINGSLKASPDQNIREAVSRISQNIVFANPTLRGLSKQLVNIITHKADTVDPKAEIENMVRRYSSGLPGKRVSGISARRDGDEPHVVLVTGSTDALGSYMIASLMQREDVVRIYALNRRLKTSTSQERRLSTFQHHTRFSYYHHPHRLADRPQSVVGNVGTKCSGNAESDRPRAGIAEDAEAAVYVYLSIASAQNWDTKRGQVPEDVIADVSVAVGNGYGGSKYVSERILEMSGLPAASFRIGQVTGAAPCGAWSITEWVPITIKSGVTLGRLPDLGVSVAWLPMNAVSGAILDVALSDNELPTMVNVAHPRPVEFEAVMKPISDALFEKKITKERLPLLHLSDWFHRLEKQAVNANEEKLRQVPAIKLFDYLRAFDQQSSGRNTSILAVTFATDRAERVSVGWFRDEV
ncbi:putative aminoadipate reductase [Pisolithus orientalis]|uniref:putative aminoadipate reductase n=1 Tax=Pisolithus orientalis TaxID=936130 RepID=UPI0022241D9E|nr:putative aminoadipate reductase [Pisolithus orientalis]KAI5992035.1 putative aminoadipate reductase [Pisolithus orientalis]